jgi:DNA-binding winged helix-turn-helix (wHTH) protein
MNRSADATLRPSAPTKPLEAMESLAGSRGTLLAVVPVNGGTSRLAIVSYLLPHPGRADNPPPAGPATDGLVVDSAQHRVLADGRDIGLVFQEFELLEFLTAHPGRAFTRGQLLARVWGDLRQATGRTVDVHIHRLRRKLGPVYGPRLVTVRRVGYMYDPPATASGPERPGRWGSG